MTWTKERPRSAGYYWVRDVKCGCPPQVLEIHTEPSMGLRRGLDLVTEEGLRVADAPRSMEWAGPVPFPAEVVLGACSPGGCVDASSP